MEDAIALSKALREHGDVTMALAAYEEARRPIVQKLVQAVDGSAGWYERFPEHMNLKSMEFAMSYITRSGRVDIEKRRRASPKFVAAYDRAQAAIG